MASIKIRENTGMISKGVFHFGREVIPFVIRDSELTITSTKGVTMEEKVALVNELSAEGWIRLIVDGKKLFRRMDIMEQFCGVASDENLIKFPEDRTA